MLMVAWCSPGLLSTKRRLPGWWLAARQPAQGTWGGWEHDAHCMPRRQGGGVRRPPPARGAAHSLP